MALGDYLAGEVAEDAAAGLLNRREALRRLGLLGLSLTSATALLSGCGDDDDGDAQGGSSAAPAASEPDPPLVGATAEAVTFAGASGEVRGAFAPAGDPKGAVLVVHENQGLTPHFFNVVGRFAAAGYSALAVDLLSPEGGTSSLADPAAAPTALSEAPLERLLGDLGSGLDELSRRAPGAKLGAVGFCFGGGMVWNLLDAGEARLAAAVPFYGPAPDEPDFGGSTAAVLAIYGELDDRVNASRDRATAALSTARLEHEVITYEGAGHAFFNDSGQRYDAAAAAQAYDAVLAWFEQHLA
ncbi:MAG: dienelactone hydrolase family protein [Acidimicrobiia bacterium]